MSGPSMDSYRSCRLCPRDCGVDRTAGGRGVCGETDRLRIAAIELHMGEEPPINGVNGSAAVFFTGCPLRCAFCQNHQISRGGIGRVLGVWDVVDRLERLHRERGAHNVNFVTPDHFLPHAAAIVEGLRGRGVCIPAVYNVSGYQRIESLREVEPVSDIYLPDFKYGDARLAGRLSGCPDYPSTALDAIGEMIRQKGFMDVSREDPRPQRGHATAAASRGVLVRHLILPGSLRNSLDALSMLYLEFGGGLPLSLMAQFEPVKPSAGGRGPARRLRTEEFERVLEHALSLGFEHLFVQDPAELPETPSPFLPDFTRWRPFAGNPLVAR